MKTGAVVQHCKAASGGAVSQTGGTASLEGGSITECEATNGGGAWVQGGTFTIGGGALTKCAAVTTVGEADANGTQAVSGGTGGGIYINKNGTLVMQSGSLTMSGGTITGNSASDAKSGGAINVKDTTVRINLGAVKLDGSTVGGNPIIKDNLYNGTQQRNLVLSQNDNAVVGIIHTTEDGLKTKQDGLSADPYIGVYAAREMPNNKPIEPFNSHGKYRQDFGTHGSTANLDCFINDWNGMYGEDCPDHADLIRWTGYVCKITVKDGSSRKLLYYKQDDKAMGKTVFKNLQSAFNALANLYTDETCTTKYIPNNAADDVRIEMLLDTYDLPTTASIAVNQSIPAGAASERNIYVTLTTAGTNAADGYSFVGGENQASIIQRGSCTGSMFNVNSQKMHLSLENVTVDGKNTPVNGSGALFNEDGAGGGIAIGHHARLDMSGGTIAHCQAKKSGGAIEIHGDVYMSGGEITACDGGRGGAINFYNEHDGTDDGRIFLSGSPRIHGNTGMYNATGTNNATGKKVEKNIDIQRLDCTCAAQRINNSNFAH